MARVYVSSIVGAPVGAVWERIRNFDALSVWHPLIRESRIENADALLPIAQSTYEYAYGMVVVFGGYRGTQW